MKTVTIIVAVFCLLATAAAAQDSCKVQADGKSLHGAALTSFAKKCCKDQAARRGSDKLHQEVRVRRHWSVSEYVVLLKNGRPVSRHPIATS